jgi:CRP-like cAMP-binding protein
MEGKSADGYAPEQQVMQQVAHLLDTQRSASADKRAALQQLEALSSSRADMPNVLAHLLAYADALTPVEVRQAAGLLLKNMAQRTLSLEARLLAHIRSCLLVALASPDRPVREAAGTAIARLAASGGLASFPNLELQLRSAASLTHSEDAADGAADTLVKLCEEAGEELENDRSVGQHLVDTLLMLTRCSLPRVRAKAFQGLNALGNELYPSSLRFRIDTFLESLFALADDPDDGVRSRVCEVLSQCISWSLKCSHLAFASLCITCFEPLSRAATRLHCRRLNSGQCSARAACLGTMLLSRFARCCLSS